jgi:hypothetical protein
MLIITYKVLSSVLAPATQEVYPMQPKQTPKQYVCNPQEVATSNALVEMMFTTGVGGTFTWTQLVQQVDATPAIAGVGTQLVREVVQRFVNNKWLVRSNSLKVEAYRVCRL